MFSVSKLKCKVLKLSKAEQYEIYEAIESNFLGEKEETSVLTTEQMDFVNERLAKFESGNYTAYTIEDLTFRLRQLRK